jgi:hypothetical protein
VVCASCGTAAAHSGSSAAGAGAADANAQNCCSATAGATAVGGHTQKQLSDTYAVQQREQLQGAAAAPSLRVRAWSPTLLLDLSQQSQLQQQLHAATSHTDAACTSTALITEVMGSVEAAPAATVGASAAQCRAMHQHDACTTVVTQPTAVASAVAADAMSWAVVPTRPAAAATTSRAGGRRGSVGTGTALVSSSRRHSAATTAAAAATDAVDGVTAASGTCEALSPAQDSALIVASRGRLLAARKVSCNMPLSMRFLYAFSERCALLFARTCAVRCRRGQRVAIAAVAVQHGAAAVLQARSRCCCSWPTAAAAVRTRLGSQGSLKARPAAALTAQSPLSVSATTTSRHNINIAAVTAFFWRFLAIFNFKIL